MLKLILIWLLVFILIEAVGFFVYFQSIGFTVNSYKYLTDKTLPRDIRICLVSDLHNVDHGNNNEAVLDSIRNINPDFVIFAGDMITKIKKKYHRPAVAFDFIKNVSKEFPVYYGVGNHEHYNLENPDNESELFRFKEDFLNLISENDIPFLENSCVDLDDINCRIYGLDLPEDYFIRFHKYPLESLSIENMLGKADEKRVNILIAHNPDMFLYYARWGADLVCSGHVHGGIVRIPGLGGVISPKLQLFPKYDAGEFTQDKCTMILSRGIGWHHIPIRIFNKAEVLEIVIHSTVND